MTKTLQAALAPLMIIGSFCSLSLFEYPLGHSWSYLSCLYGLAIWSFLTYSIYYPIYSMGWRMMHLALYFYYIIILITAITSILASLFINETVVLLYKLSNYNLDEELRELILQFILQIKLREVKFGVGHFSYGYNFIWKELKMCLHELSLVDDVMEAVGAPKEYQRLRKRIIRITILWIVYIFQNFVEVIYFTSFVFDLDFDKICNICILSYPCFVHVLSALIWGTILGLVCM
ncbi:hypothetical protein ALC60_00976 [Trachymyrmex zeteki]|uniref:Gustatory receptor n=1 Tax=Mycetomoellerius zeteki TaxID=64791 RepID=A0A151XI61_9HYME|nr:hypothetical protein ALC60_00976 [Trachymyrmex zeteki]